MIALCGISLMLSMSLILSMAMENEFDTYNADSCQRVRQSWSSLSDADKSLYIRGLVKLREQTSNNAQTYNDEYETIMAEHMTLEANTDHKESNWFFWHAYLIYEVESRVRNLGGEFACFALPYWDYTLESMSSLRGYDDDPLVFDDGEFVGGYGNPIDAYSVNGYSWDVSVEQWWQPQDDKIFPCDAAEDSFPICSLKRRVSMDEMATIPGPIEAGRNLREMTEFANFTRWFIEDTDGSLGAVCPGLSITSNSFDPIWVMFHSFIQLQQFLWTDCHDYDQIDPDELDAFPEAYSTFCDELAECTGQELDDPFEYALNSLKDAPWSFIHSQNLTVRKAYYAPRWNIRYDLGGGDGFWANGGVGEWCDDKLNDEWFTLTSDREVQESALSQSLLPRMLALTGWSVLSSLYVVVSASLLLLAMVLTYQMIRDSKRKAYTVVP